MIISNLYQTKIEASSYNVDIGSTGTVVTVTLLDFNNTAVTGKSVTLTCSMGYFNKNGDTTIENTSTTSITTTTDSNGQITATWTASDWGVCTFSTNTSNIQVIVTGWKSTAINSVITLFYNDKYAYLDFHGNCTVGQNNNYTTIATIPSGFRPNRQVIGMSQETFMGIRINESGQIQTADVRGTATSWGIWVSTPLWRRYQ